MPASSPLSAKSWFWANNHSFSYAPFERPRYLSRALFIFYFSYSRRRMPMISTSP